VPKLGSNNPNNPSSNNDRIALITLITLVTLITLITRTTLITLITLLTCETRLLVQGRWRFDRVPKLGPNNPNNPSSNNDRIALLYELLEGIRAYFTKSASLNYYQPFKSHYI
jgi:hypothetical protein